MEEEFGKQIMNDAELKQTGTRNLKDGYPDIGCGVYSDKLSYADWFRWNKINRGHLNFLETVTIVTFLTLVTGLYMPWTAIVLGGTYGAFRPFYFLNNRLIGFVPGVLCTFGLFFTSLYSTYSLIAQLSNLKDLK